MKQTTAIQLYKSAKDNTGKEITIQDAIDYISGNSLAAIVNNIRRNKGIVADCEKLLQTATDEEIIKQLQQRKKEHQWTADELKKSLPAVTWAGTFHKRLKTEIKEYSGLICLDIDKLPAGELQALKEKLKQDRYTAIIFTSPSGNGLKVIVRISAMLDYFLQAFVALEKYYQDNYGISIDPSGKDICRLCFLSTDSDFLCNYQCEVFQVLNETTQPLNPSTSKPTQPTKQEIKQLKATAATAADVWQSTLQYMEYSEGQRNDFIYKYACNCNRKGIDMMEAEAFAHSQASDLKPDEITSSIRSAYTHNAAEWAKYAKKIKPENNGNNTATAKDIRNSGPGMAGNKSAGHSRKDTAFNGKEYLPSFWYETENKQIRDKEGNPVKQYNIYYNGLIDFLSHAGYYRLPLANKSYEFIRYLDNVCDTVPLHDMRDHVMDWCKDCQATANDNSDKDEWVKFSKLREMLMRGVERYFNINKLSNLPYKKIEFIKDTKDTAFFFFRNCYVKVTENGITTHPVTELQKSVWQGDIIDRDFSREKIMYPVDDKGYFKLEDFKCEFAKYMALASSNPNHYKDIDPETVNQRFFSHCSAVGYMLHGWKNKIGKAIVAVDHKVPEDKSEQNGGTGKSIYGTSFQYVKSICIIDGREFKEDYPFRFERVGVDTKIIVMMDCRQNLDFGSFFVPITGDFTYNKRHTGYITLPYDDSPKWWFDTNFTFKGDGSSFRRRQHIIEFDDYFDENHTPFEEFGHLLFDDWDDAQWNLFYNHYFQCVQTFLATGLIDYSKSNYDSRRLLVETPTEFIDFLDATDANGKYQIPRDRWIIKKDIMKKWNEEAVSFNMNKVTPHSFTKWVKKYCSTKKLELIKDKTNGVEYYLIATAAYAGPKKFSGQATLF